MEKKCYLLKPVITTNREGEINIEEVRNLIAANLFCDCMKYCQNVDGSYSLAISVKLSDSEMKRYKRDNLISEDFKGEVKELNTNNLFSILNRSGYKKMKFTSECIYIDNMNLKFI